MDDYFDRRKTQCKLKTHLSFHSSQKMPIPRKYFRNVKIKSKYPDQLMDKNNQINHLRISVTMFKSCGMTTDSLIL